MGGGGFLSDLCFVSKDAILAILEVMGINSLHSNAKVKPSHYILIPIVVALDKTYCNIPDVCISQCKTLKITLSGMPLLAD